MTFPLPVVIEIDLPFEKFFRRFLCGTAAVADLRDKTVTLIGKTKKIVSVPPIMFFRQNFSHLGDFIEIKIEFPALVLYVFP